MAAHPEKTATPSLALAESSRATVRAELERALDAVDLATLVRLGDALSRARRVFVFGTGRSGLVLKMFAMRLMHLGLAAQVVGETTTTAIAAGDVLLLASGSGSTKSVLAMAQTARQAGAGVVSVTATAGSRLVELSDDVLLIPAGTKSNVDTAASRQYAGSLFEQSTLISLDILFHTLWKATGLPAEALSSRHTNLE
jgi:6-phospho-3-hexuloisomerase